MNCASCGQPLPHADNASYDETSGILQWGKKIEQFGYKQKRIFGAMWKSPGRVFTRDYLCYLLEDDASALPEMKTIDVHVCNIRRLIKGAPFSIITVFGVGYKLVRRK